MTFHPASCEAREAAQAEAKVKIQAKIQAKAERSLSPVPPGHYGLAPSAALTELHAKAVAAITAYETAVSHY